jgi:ribosome maturation factor RimP
MDPVEEIRRLADACLEDESQFILKVELSSRSGPKKLLIMVDGDKGVTIDDCANISRKLSKLLDEMGLLQGQYHLEVSTPGVDHPLTFTRQFHKQVGRRLRVTTGGKTEEGLLERVTEGGVVMSGFTGSGKTKVSWTKEIPFTELDKAFVLISFN